MKVVVLGGYGVFGSRLAELLVRDGHAVVITGRDAVALRRLAQRLGCDYQVLDHRRHPASIFEASPEVVVDAAGPFQTGWDDAYQIPRWCLTHGTDYLDLSDDADFTQGMVQLDDEARRCGRRLLSGASSVPGISSVIAADLCAGLDDVELIDIAILPGNRAPRGASVILSIVGQMGLATRVWRGGVWRSQSCWSDPRSIQLAPGVVRTARYIEVPDIRLFPSRFRSASVVFRAGLELSVFNVALRLIAAWRQRWRFPVTRKMAAWLQWIATLLLPFGTDRGGMRVMVVGRRGPMTVRREWRLLAERGDGPCIPAVMARTLIRRLDRVPPGSRACLAEASRQEVEQAMSDLAVSVGVEETSHPPLFQRVLGSAWDRLPPEVQALHRVQDVESFSGSAQVTRGASWMARLTAWLFGFPPAAEHVAVTVTKTRTDVGEVWERDFGGQVFRSTLTPAPDRGRCRERFGVFTFELDLPVEAGCLRLPVHRGWLLGMPLPRMVLPESDSREYVADGAFHFDVGLRAPLGGGLIVRYRGRLHPDRDQPPSD